MNRRLLICVLAGLTAFPSARDARGQQSEAGLPADLISAALTLAGDSAPAQKAIQAYAVQSRTGLGAGPFLGYVSTPFSRVVMASLAARKAGRTLTASDVAPALVTPELHVFLLAQTAAYEERVSTVESVVVTPRNQASGAPVQPIRVMSASAQDYALYGVPQGAGATLAAFPLTAVAPGNNLHVVFSQVIRGSSALTNCKDCTFPLNPKGVK
jgi:hypothetical protein